MENSDTPHDDKPLKELFPNGSIHLINGRKLEVINCAGDLLTLQQVVDKWPGE